MGVEQTSLARLNGIRFFIASYRYNAVHTSCDVFRVFNLSYDFFFCHYYRPEDHTFNMIYYCDS